MGEASLEKVPLSSYEMPPAVPDFDARFTSGRLVETYPATLDPKANYEFGLTITSDAYPIVVKWEVPQPAAKKMALMMAGQLLGVMEGKGSVRISALLQGGISVKLGDVAAVPKVFALSQNYPNPFNPSTRFTVDVPRGAVVDVTVYDILGRKITTLMSGQQGAGSHQMEWDGRDGLGMSVPTGIYFVRMQSDNFSAVRKIMLMK
jgi:hypothetical protein